VLSSEELITAQKLNDLGAPTLRIKELTITARELADGSINSDKLDVDLEAQLGVPDNSVTTAKIVDDAVTTNKIASDQVLKWPSIRPENGTTPLYRPMGLLAAAGDIQATVGSTTLTARTITIPANLLSTNGDMLRFTHVHYFTANANTKNTQLQWAGVTFFSSSTPANDIWVYRTVCLIRTSANTQRIQFYHSTTTPGASVSMYDGAANLAASNDYKVLIQGVANNDVKDYWFMCEYLPTP
jgi:hypothetical protein